VLAHTPVGRDDSGHKTHRHCINKFHGSRPCPEQGIQKAIIGHELRKHLTAESPADLGLLIVMPVPAFITAEFLVCTPILYPIPALQACRYNSDSLLCVTHPSRFFPKYEYINPSSQEEGAEIYVFGRRIFCFLT
jgi:hypothetical protein